MNLPRAPYALGALPFRFRAIAALAGRAPLGGPREVALAAYLGARLAHDTLPERGLVADARKPRAEAARTWMSALAVPSVARATLAELFAASAGTPSDVAPILRSVIAVTSPYLDGNARLELEWLADLLAAAEPPAAH
ncbi:MAG TPA: hypothetical protein VMH39_13305 [Gemmatimonadaceae bacterium]|nr:hypothetical protein [Gemmatimonadaceae bacterium]